MWNLLEILNSAARVCKQLGIAAWGDVGRCCRLVCEAFSASEARDVCDREYIEKSAKETELL